MGRLLTTGVSKGPTPSVTWPIQVTTGFLSETQAWPAVSTAISSRAGPSSSVGIPWRVRKSYRPIVPLPRATVQSQSPTSAIGRGLGPPPPPAPTTLPLAGSTWATLSGPTEDTGLEGGLTPPPRVERRATSAAMAATTKTPAATRSRRRGVGQRERERGGTAATAASSVGRRAGAAPLAPAGPPGGPGAGGGGASACRGPC